MRGALTTREAVSMAAKNICLLKTHYLLMSASNINANTMYKLAGKWGCVYEDGTAFVKVSIDETFKSGRAVLYGINCMFFEEAQPKIGGGWQQVVHDVKKIIVDFKLSKNTTTEYYVIAQNVKVVTRGGLIMKNSKTLTDVNGVLKVQDVDNLFFAVKDFGNYNLARNFKPNWLGYILKGVKSFIKEHPIITIILIVFIGAYIYGGLFN